MGNSARGHVSGIPAAHDVLGAPNEREDAAGPDGETNFHQPSPNTHALDLTKAKPVHRNGDLKYTPNAGV